MRAEIKEAWIDALRSGKYEQGRGALRSGSNKYCCLGVLADVLGLKWQTGDSGVDGYCLPYEEETGNYGPTPEGDYNGFEHPAIATATESMGLDPTNLVDLNDDKRYDFESIANYIEENAK